MYTYVHTCMPVFRVHACTRMYVRMYAKPLSADLSEHPPPCRPCTQAQQGTNHNPRSGAARPAKPGCQPAPEPAPRAEGGFPCPCAPPTTSLPAGPKRSRGTGARAAPGRAGPGGRGHGGGGHRQPPEPGGGTGLSPGAARRAPRQRPRRFPQRRCPAGGRGT